MVVARSWVGGGRGVWGGYFFMGIEFQFGKVKTYQRQIVGNGCTIL